MQLGRDVLVPSAALLLGVLPLVAAHSDDAHSSVNMGGAHGTAMSNATKVAEQVAPSYFRHTEYAGWMYAHIGLMIIAWVIVLPIAVMLSIARSRMNMPAQFVFLAANALGLFTSIVYNSKTPDLYENNAHHKIGWVVTWVATAWFLLAFIDLYMGRTKTRHAMTTQNMAQYDRLQDLSFEQQDQRWSGESAGRSSATLCSGSRSPSSDFVPHHKLEEADNDQGEEQIEDVNLSEDRGFLRNASVDRFLSRKLPRFTSKRASLAIKVPYIFIERFIVILAFLALTTGGVVYGGLFRARLVFSGAAHFVKGGIFFWYGLLTLGRWMGAFSDYGWAWNVKPQQPMVSRFAARLPSAEFTESFVIWLYGASNIFLEHLNAWGQAWSAQDFEHISITIMFFGGGLLGMLIESETVRNLLNMNIALKQEEALTYDDKVEQQREEWVAPKTYKTSLNPMPAVVILLLGLMMARHHQSSMVSTMMHAQWGNLFVGFALARAATYLLLYLSPPASYFPSRPPTELVASFCLISGGLIFMGSATDTVRAIENNGLDAMFLFTVVMGFTGLVMSWTAIAFAIKGWATRREAKRAA